MSVGVLGEPLPCYPPYTAPRLNAACFGAMSVDEFGDPSLRAASYTLPKLNAACFGAMGMGFLCNPLLCYPLLHCT